MLRVVSSPIRVNSTRQLVAWSGASMADAIAQLAGRTPFRLKFVLRGRARLYSFWVSSHREGDSNGFVQGRGFGRGMDRGPVRQGLELGDHGVDVDLYQLTSA